MLVKKLLTSNTKHKVGNTFRKKCTNSNKYLRFDRCSNFSNDRSKCWMFILTELILKYVTANKC